MQKFINTGIKLTESDIMDVSKSMNLIFPKDLVELYILYNGGEIEGEKYFYIDENNDVDICVKLFLPMKYKQSENDILLEELYQSLAVEKKLIPLSYIPFAIDDGGYPYCINTNDGKIYIGYLEDYYVSPESTIRFISDSLIKFINGMKTENEAYN